MRIVIELSDETYKDIKEENGIYGMNNGLEPRITGKVVGAIQSGTVLPKGHGRLIDADGLTKETKSYISDTSNLHYDDLVEAEAYNSAYYNCLDEIDDALTIIKAHRAESEG